MNRRYRIRKKEPTAPFSFGKHAYRETAEERHEATARIITLTHGGKSQVLRPGPVPLYAGSRLRQSSEGLSAKNGESDVLHPRQPREITGTDSGCRRIYRINAKETKDSTARQTATLPMRPASLRRRDEVFTLGLPSPAAASCSSRIPEIRVFLMSARFRRTFFTVRTCVFPRVPTEPRLTKC